MSFETFYSQDKDKHMCIVKIGKQSLIFLDDDRMAIKNKNGEFEEVNTDKFEALIREVVE